MREEKLDNNSWTFLRQQIFHYEDSVHDPQTPIPVESWDS